MEPNSSNQARVITIIAVVVIAVGAIAYALTSKKAVAPTALPTTEQTTQTTSATSSATQSATTNTSAGTSNSEPVAGLSSATPASQYTDGTYTATGSYLSPGGDEKIGVSVTLKNDVITATSVTPEPVSSEGKRYQAIFAANYKSLVVGKNITDVHLTTVSGSSLTPEGFNDAISQIETKAKA